MTAQRRAPAIAAVAAAESIGGHNPIVGFRRADLLDSARSVAAEALRNRRHTAHILLRLAGATMAIVRDRMVHRPAAKDHRFAGCAWSENFLYRVLLQLYLAAHAELDLWLGGTELGEPDRARARFLMSLVLDAFAPSNPPLAPVALKRFIETGGTGAISGPRQFAGDVRHRGLPARVGTGRFEVGVNLATTAVAVVWNPAAAHRNWDLGTYIYAAREALDVVRAITGCRDVNLTGACSGGISGCCWSPETTTRSPR
jgi:polyhydroxyalkanoate synthase